MKFDFTEGKSAIYMVSIYDHVGCHDQLYYHYYRDAEAKLKELSESGFYESGTVMSLYDIKKDVRKRFIRI